MAYKYDKLTYLWCCRQVLQPEDDDAAAPALPLPGQGVHVRALRADIHATARLVSSPQDAGRFFFQIRTSPVINLDFNFFFSNLHPKAWLMPSP